MEGKISWFFKVFAKFSTRAGGGGSRGRHIASITTDFYFLLKMFSVDTSSLILYRTHSPDPPFPQTCPEKKSSFLVRICQHHRFPVPTLLFLHGRVANWVQWTSHQALPKSFSWSSSGEKDQPKSFDIRLSFHIWPRYYWIFPLCMFKVKHFCTVFDYLRLCELYNESFSACLHKLFSPTSSNRHPEEM